MFLNVLVGFLNIHQFDIQSALEIYLAATVMDRNTIISSDGEENIKVATWN